MISQIFKRLILLACIASVCSCDAWTIGRKPKYIESIVWAYYRYTSAEAVIQDAKRDNGSKYDISIDCLSTFTRYNSEENREWFESICNKYGDNHYHGNMVDKNLRLYKCIVPDVKGIQIISEDDFDEEHPKGVYLNDCFDVYYDDLKNIIESDYTVLTPRTTIKSLDSISSEEMSMLYYRNPGTEDKENKGYLSLFGLKATKLPSGPSVQHLNIEFKTEYGNTISCPIEFDFSQSMLARNK